MKLILYTTKQVFREFVKLILKGYKEHFISSEKNYITKPYHTKKEEKYVKDYGYIPNIPRSIFFDED